MRKLIGLCAGWAALSALFATAPLFYPILITFADDTTILIAQRTARSRGRARTYPGGSGGRSFFASYDVLMFVTAGQSNSRGVSNESSTPVTGIHSSQDWQWCQNGATNVSELDVMRYGSNCWADAEHPNSGIIDEWRERLPADFGGIMMGVTCGVSGSALSSWWTTTAQTNWTNCRTEIADAVTDLETNPGDYGLTGTPTILVIAMTWQQGESDSATAEATYDTRLQAMIDDLETYAASQTGQTHDPHVVLEQISTYSQSGAGGSTTPTNPTLAQIDICERETNVHCVGGTYAHAFELASPYLHKQPGNHRLSGEIMGRRLWGAWMGGAYSRDAPRFSSVTVGTDQTTATLCFDQDISINTQTLEPHQDGGLPDATALGARTDGGVGWYGCGAHPNGDYGLELTSDGTPPTLSSCTASGTNCVQCTMSAALTVADRPVFRVAWTAGGTSVTPAGCQGNEDNAHSNIVSATTGLYAQHDLCELVPDGGTPCVTVRDGGVIDGGVTDGGIVYLVYGQDQSWADPASVYGLDTNYQSVYHCTTDAGPCAYFYDEAGGVARPAFEGTDAGTGTYIVPTAQTFARALDEGGNTVPVGLVVDAFPGTATDLQNTTNLVAWDDQVAADMLADHTSACVWPLAYIHGGGGYQMQSSGDPFTDWTTAVTGYLGQVRTSAGALTGICSDWTSTDLELLYNGGGHQAWGQASGTWYQHGYSDDFASLADGDNHFCGQMSHIVMGADELHPNETGAGQLADLWASCLYRYAEGDSTESMQVTAVTVTDADTITLSVYTPCADEGTCAEDPPIVYETTAMAAQETEGNVVTGGVHFWNDGGLQQPASAANVTPGALSTCDGGVCTVTLDFDGGVGHYDEVTFCDTAEGPDAGPGHGASGGCNFYAPRTDIYTNYNDGGTGDWLRQSRHAVASYDAGPADSGVSDAGGPSYHQNLSATNLDDSDDYYTLTGGMTALDGVSAFTLCFWDREGTRGVNEYLFGEYTASNRKLAFFSRLTNAYFYLSSATGTGERSEVTSGVYQNGIWQHTCIAFDGGQTGDANRLRWYVTDHAEACAGACQETLTFTGSVPATTTSPSSGDFYIGAGTSAAPSWGSSTSYFDEFNIWTSALTAAQIDEVMVGAALDHSATVGTVPAADHCYRFETGYALTDACGSTALSSSTGSPTLPTTPQVRPIANTQRFSPSANSDYLSLTGYGGSTTSLCEAGWFEIGNQFDAVMNQWGSGAANERHWLGHNPSGVSISAWGNGTTNGGREFNSANTRSSNSSLTAGTRAHLASCFDGGNTEVLTWLNGVRAEGGTQGTLVSTLATDREWQIGQNTHTRYADEVVLSYGDIWTDAEVCGIYCATRIDTDASSVTGQNGAPDCDCDAVNIDEGDIDLTGPTDTVWYKVDGDLTEELGGTSLTGNGTIDSSDYTDN